MVAEPRITNGLTLKKVREVPVSVTVLFSRRVITDCKTLTFCPSKVVLGWGVRPMVRDRLRPFCVRAAMLNVCDELNMLVAAVSKANAEVLAEGAAGVDEPPPPPPPQADKIKADKIKIFFIKLPKKFK